MDTTNSPRSWEQAPEAQPIKRVPEAERPFGRRNFIFMLVSLGLIVLGFILMSGPGSTPETGFNPDIFSTRRIIVGPTIAFLGFLFMACAIIIRPDKRKPTENK